MKNIFKFIFAVFVCELLGNIGSIFTVPAISGWYVTLQKPFFNPPNWIFAPVWTFLFFLMGVSLYLVLKKDLKEKEVRKGLIIFTIQFALNIGWSFLFFGLRNPFYAFFEIIILWIAILLTILQFRKIEKVSSYLLLPYLIWVTFAAILNFSVWQLNI